MPYSFGRRSRSRLAGVHPDLVRLAEEAISTSGVDFAISEGLRTMERQRKLFQAGASKTMNSRHLTGHAIDVVALVGNEARWEFELYRRVAVQFAQASMRLSIPVEWGACWCPIGGGANDLDALVAAYVRRCKLAGKRPLIDGPHFQLPWAQYPA